MTTSKYQCCDRWEVFAPGRPCAACAAAEAGRKQRTRPPEIEHPDPGPSAALIRLRRALAEETVEAMIARYRARGVEA